MSENFHTATRAEHEDMARLREIDQQLRLLNEEAKFEQAALARKYGLRNGDHILIASGLIMRGAPAAPAVPVQVPA